MGVEHLTCEIVPHTALPSEQTQFCTPYSVIEVKYIEYIYWSTLGEMSLAADFIHLYNTIICDISWIIFVLKEVSH